MGQFPAETFEELFQQTKGIPWEELIPPDGRFTVIGSSVKSVLHSVPACQSIVKKAIASRLGECYGMEVLPETGAEHRVKISMLKDVALLTMDTSGTALHKRGYRTADVAAPIKETLAAALVELSFWKPGRVLLDPCCGSGTIPIEAALIGRNIAPGLSRHFAAEAWELVEQNIWKEERQAAYAAIRQEEHLEIYASDIDPKAIAAARANAQEAGVEDCIRFSRKDLSRLQELPAEGGIMISNLPYGKRIGSDRGITLVYRALSGFMKRAPRWSFFLITSDKGLEKALHRRADRRRKLFNGNIETTYYQYHGKK
jgi:putative N6-adenine-specific DNA methylase